MPIPINCPGCKKRYVLRDEMRGKQVRCKQCQRSFVVGETPSAPRLTPEREPNGNAEPAVPRKNSKTGLLIVGGLVVCVLLFTCCGGVAGGAYYVFGRAKQTTENFASQMAFGDKDFQAGLDKAMKDAAKVNAPARRDASPAGGGSLDGTYIVTAVEMMGQKAPKDRLKMYSDYVIRGDSMTYSMSGTRVSGTIKTDRAAKPARLDFTAEGTTSYCIYKLEGDTLTLCMGGTEPGKRPIDFKTSSKDAFALIVMKKK